MGPNDAYPTAYLMPRKSNDYSCELPTPVNFQTDQEIPQIIDISGYSNVTSKTPLKNPLVNQPQVISDLSSGTQRYPNLGINRIIRPSPEKIPPAKINDLFAVLKPSDAGIYPNSIVQFQRPSISPVGHNAPKRKKVGRPKGSKNKAPRTKITRNVECTKRRRRKSVQK